MSTSMRLRPPSAHREYIGATVRVILSRRFWDTDGSVTAEAMIEENSSDHYYLMGVRDAFPVGSVERADVSRIIAMIERYGSAEVSVVR